MGRILGIDYGTKRIGLAITDPLKLFAYPLKTIRTCDFDKFLEDFLKSESVEEIVIGYPVQLNNSASASVKYLNPFLKNVRKTFPGIPVNLIDERFTSEMALKVIVNSGIKKKERQDKSLVDKISASIILQSFLDKRKSIIHPE